MRNAEIVAELIENMNLATKWANGELFVFGATAWKGRRVYLRYSTDGQGAPEKLWWDGETLHVEGGSQGAREACKGFRAALREDLTRETPDREQVKAFYRALIETGVEKEHVDEMINRAMETSIHSRVYEAARVVTSQACVELDRITFKTTDESENWGAFLTGGHQIHDFSDARTFVTKYMGQAWCDEHVPNDCAY